VGHERQHHDRQHDVEACFGKVEPVGAAQVEGDGRVFAAGEVDASRLDIDRVDVGMRLRGLAGDVAPTEAVIQHASRRQVAQQRQHGVVAPALVPVHRRVAAEMRRYVGESIAGVVWRHALVSGWGPIPSTWPTVKCGRVVDGWAGAGAIVRWKMLGGFPELRARTARHNQADLPLNDMRLDPISPDLCPGLAVPDVCAAPAPGAMRVLHLTLSYSNGGRREAIAALANGLRELDVGSHLGCLDEFGCEPAERASFDGSFCLERRSLFDPVARRRLASYCREQRIDVVHAHDAASQAMAALAVPWGPPAQLMTFHRTRGIETARFRDRLRNALVGLRVGAVVTASRERRQHYVDHNYFCANKVSCVPLGIDLGRFRPDPAMRARTRQLAGAGEGTLLVGTVGHFGHEKGVDLAISAFQEFLRRNP